MKKIVKKIIIGSIKVYQKYISIWVNKLFHYDCKFYPTCSEYTKQAIQKYGIIKGVFLGVRRIIKCNPFSKGGYDPLK